MVYASQLFLDFSKFLIYALILQLEGFIIRPLFQLYGCLLEIIRLPFFVEQETFIQLLQIFEEHLCEAKNATSHEHINY